jgi:hypothetical protein
MMYVKTSIKPQYQNKEVEYGKHLRKDCKTSKREGDVAPVKLSICFNPQQE